MREERIAEIENIIGYTFNDKSILVRAFTHNSKTQDVKKHYQALEFLGDSLVDFIVAEKLINSYPDSHEGELTIARSKIVSKEPLARIISELGLEKYLVVDDGAKEIKTNPKMMSDIFESVTAAIYLDSKDIHKAEYFVLSKLAPIFNEIKVEGEDYCPDYKSILNQYKNKHKLKIWYSEPYKHGEDNDAYFYVECLIGTEVYGRGEGHSIKLAQQMAAKNALNYLHIIYND